MTIDLSNINSPQELHLKLKTAFNFNDNYRMNWDSFILSLEKQSDSLPDSISIINWKKFSNNFPSEAELLKERISEFNRNSLESEIEIN